MSRNLLSIFVPIIENGEELCIREFFFCSFCTKNQVTQIIIGKGRVIYQIKALSVVIKTAFKIQKFFLCLENPV